MNKWTQLLPFLQNLFDDLETARIVAGIIQGCSPRLSDIAREMSGNEAANYKALQRFLEKTNPQEALLRLFQEEASFVIGDPTEMPRPQAKKTEYVGTLNDCETKGYWLMLLAAPILIAYAVALVVGEVLRAQFFPAGSRKNKLFSGPFIFLKLKPNLSPPYPLSGPHGILSTRPPCPK